MTARRRHALSDSLAAPDWVGGALAPTRHGSPVPARRSTSGAAGGRRPAEERRSGSSPAVARVAGLTAPTAGRLLVFATVALLLFGLVMAYSASTAQGFFAHGSHWYFLKKQLIYAAGGVVLMVVLSRIDYRLWRRAAAPLAVAVAGLLVVVALPGVGATINGARRWIDFGFATLQPSEFAKPAAVLLVAALVVGRGTPVTTGKGLLRVVGLALVPMAVLIMIGKDLSTTIVLTLAVGAVLVAAGARWRHLLVLGVVLPAVAGLMILMEPYRTARLTAFLDPWAYADTSGFQTTQSLISVASGQVFGVGLGNSVQKFGFLPEQTTDMITGIIGEELGLVGLLLLIALYGVLAWAGLRLALTCRDPFARLVCAGLTVAVVGQALLNLGAAMGLVPILGVPLPLVSCGGTSLLAVLAGTGIMLNIATNRRSHIVASPERRRSPAGRGGDRWPHGAGARGR